MVTKKKPVNIPVSQSLKRASRTLKERSVIDASLKREMRLFETSLEMAAFHAVNSLRCLESLKMILVKPPGDIDKSIRLLRNAIRTIVYTGADKPKKAAQKERTPRPETENAVQ